MGSRVTFLEAARDKVLLFDGAMGTEIQALDPGPEDFPDGKEGFNDGLVLSRPEWISRIHRGYIEAGADCIETNSFGSNKIKLDEYGFGERTIEINEKAASLASAEAGRAKRDVYVVGSMGPTGYLPSSNDPDLGQIPLDTIQEAFALQAEGLIQGGADALIIETSQDILEVKLAIEGAHAAMEKSGSSIPLIANTTLDRYGKMLLGTTVQAAYTTVSDMGIDFFGLNCSTGPREMAPSVRWLSGQGHGLLVVPNAGMPENEGGRSVYGMTPDDMAGVLGGFISEYPQVRMVGGCCGTTPAHISALRRAIDGAQTGGR